MKIFYPKIYIILLPIVCIVSYFLKTKTPFKSYLRHRCPWCCPACCWVRSRRAPCSGVSAAPSPAPHPPAQRAPPCCFRARHYRNPLGNKGSEAWRQLLFWGTTSSTVLIEFDRLFLLLHVREVLTGEVGTVLNSVLSNISITNCKFHFCNAGETCYKS